MSESDEAVMDSGTIVFRYYLYLFLSWQITVLEYSTIPVNMTNMFMRSKQNKTYAGLSFDDKA